MGTKLESLRGLSQDANASNVLRFLIERTGIVREPISGWLDFTHRTFQEFLAAKAAIYESDTGLLIEKAENDHWREVIIMAAGLANKDTREQLITALLNRGDVMPAGRHYLHLLAVACLEASVELTPELQGRIRTSLSNLVPPQNLAQAKDLSSAKDLAVPFLNYKPDLEPRVYSACIQCLAMIGGDAALEVLEEYGKDERQDIIDELVGVWSRFNIKDYGVRVLQPNSKELTVERLRDLEGFQFLTNLVSLTLRRCIGVDDLTPLSDLSKLEQLDVSYNDDIKSLAPLARLVNLRVLHLAACTKINSIYPLRGLIALEELNLARCRALNSLDGISELQKLSQVDISECSFLDDLSPIEGLPALSKLRMVRCPQISDLKFLSQGRKLISLDVSECVNLTDISALRGTHSIVTLKLQGCGRLSDIGALSNMSRLEELDLERCTSIVDLTSLSSVYNLEKLRLSWCRNVVDLSPLSTLINLKDVELVKCDSIRDLTPLIKLPQLERVRLGDLVGTIEVPPELYSRIV